MKNRYLVVIVLLILNSVSYTQHKKRVGFVDPVKYPPKFEGKYINDSKARELYSPQVIASNIIQLFKTTLVKYYNNDKHRNFIFDTVNSPDYLIYIISIENEPLNVYEQKNREYNYKITYGIYKSDDNSWKSGYFGYPQYIYFSSVELAENYFNKYFHYPNKREVSKKAKKDGVPDYINYLAEEFIHEVLTDSYPFNYKPPGADIYTEKLDISFNFGFKLNSTTRNGSSALGAYALNIDYTLKKFNWGYYQIGIGGVKSLAAIDNIPINNVNTNVSFFSYYLNIRNKINFNLYQPYRDRADYFLRLYGVYNIGYGIIGKGKKNNFYLEKGLAHEAGIGIKRIGAITYNLAILYNTYTFKGRLISQDPTLSDVNLNLSFNSLRLEVGVGISLWRSGYYD